MNIDNLSGKEVLTTLMPIIERLNAQTNALLHAIETMLNDKPTPTKGKTIGSYVEELEDGSIILNVDYINSKKNPQQKHDYIFLDSAEDLKAVAETALEYLNK